VGRGLKREPARRVGEERGEDVRRVALDPDPRGLGKGGGEDRPAANVPARALEHQLPFVAVPTSAERPHQEPHNPGQRGLVDPIGTEVEEGVERRRLGDNDHARNSAQEPGYERRSAPREVKDHARRLERRLAVESNERLEPGPDSPPGARARRPAGDRLVEERFSETLR
jgi:hypothetical protein